MVDTAKCRLASRLANRCAETAERVIDAADGTGGFLETLEIHQVFTYPVRLHAERPATEQMDATVVAGTQQPIHQRSADQTAGARHQSGEGLLPGRRQVSGVNTISTRRFRARPSGVSLDAMGWVWPLPVTTSRSGMTSRDMR